ncbi:MAG: septal ring lytic transglycosylase RlpA family protein [Methyloligellaceae bacterium]
MGVAIISAVTLSACSWPWGSKKAKLGPRVVPLGQPVPKGGGVHKVGLPYKIGGTWYYPKEDRYYNRVGTASWYGELFHGRRTANGEIYDMDALTAAHPTLPLPSYAQVTNLANGRTMVVRLNDRGPYARNRIIDLSRRSAATLGFRQSGTATVRVKYLGRAPLNGDDSYERRYLANRDWMQRYPPRRGFSRRSANDLTVGSVHRTRAASRTYRPAQAHEYYVQAGAFRVASNAERRRRKLARAGNAHIETMTARGGLFYRVVLGPYSERRLADHSLRNIVSYGINDARVFTRPQMTISRN